MVRLGRWWRGAAAVAVLSSLLGGPGTSPAAAGVPAAVASPAPAGTSFLDHDALLKGVQDPAWYKANIPFLDVPDQQILDVYYYRWQTYKEHLVYTGPEYGWLSSEFLQPVGYGAPYGGSRPRPDTRSPRGGGCATRRTPRTSSTTGSVARDSSPNRRPTV